MAIHLLYAQRDGLSSVPRQVTKTFHLSAMLGTDAFYLLGSQFLPPMPGCAPAKEPLLVGRLLFEAPLVFLLPQDLER